MDKNKLDSLHRLIDAYKRLCDAMVAIADELAELDRPKARLVFMQEAARYRGILESLVDKLSGGTNA